MAVEDFEQRPLAVTHNLIQPDAIHRRLTDCLQLLAMADVDVDIGDVMQRIIPADGGV